MIQVYRQGKRLYLPVSAAGSAAEKGGGAAAEYQPEYGENYGGNRVQQYE